MRQPQLAAIQLKLLCPVGHKPVLIQHLCRDRPVYIKLDSRALYRGAERRMAADGEPDIPAVVVHHIPHDAHRCPVNPIADQQGKPEGIERQRLLIAVQDKPQLILHLGCQSEIHISGKSMLSRLVLLAVVAHLVILVIADQRKQHRRHSAPIVLISRPHIFFSGVLLDDGDQLCPVRIHPHPDLLVLQGI